MLWRIFLSVSISFIGLSVFTRIASSSFICVIWSLETVPLEINMASPIMRKHSYAFLIMLNADSSETVILRVYFISLSAALIMLWAFFLSGCFILSFKVSPPRSHLKQIHWQYLRTG